MSANGRFVSVVHTSSPTKAALAKHDPRESIDTPPGPPACAVKDGSPKTRGEGPSGPVGPAGPVGPVAPVAPVGPVGPADPVGPVGPAGPVAPVGPAGPVAPVGPAGPTLFQDTRVEPFGHVVPAETI